MRSTPRVVTADEIRQHGGPQNADELRQVSALSWRHYDTMLTVEHCESMFGSLCTNRLIRRRDVLSCVQAGLVKSIGKVSLCDDDGSIMEPERCREGFVLTESGRAALNATREMSHV